MILGCAWYPEQWPEARWAEDLRLMREAGITMTRIGEFAWSRLEPDEHQYDLDWLESAVELAGRHNIIVVLGTPTAAPPAWMTQRYPEVLAVRENGRRAEHGGRCHYSPASPRYRQFCRDITEQMAQRFGAHPNVTGWQIDNEYNSMSYDEETRRQFQLWLRERFQTLDNLNAHWTTAYWSQEYTDWAQIPLASGGNPGLMLETRHFITHLYRTFQREQIDAIRKYATSEQWITHNFMGWFDMFDHYELSKDLDMASWDNYVGTGHLDFRTNGAQHDLTRGFKRKNFWLLETQPGSVNWSSVCNALDRGEVRTMAWHAVGHGADAVSYWQWRSALSGQEQYHGTLVAPDGRPRPLYEEVSKIGVEFAQMRDLLQGTSPVSQVAILHSYDDRWALQNAKQHKDYDAVAHLLSFYRPLRELGCNIDIIHPSAPLGDYQLVIAPHLHLLDEELTGHLLDYTEGGGHLLLGPCSGMKDAYNALLPMRQPGPLAATLGAHVEEYYILDQPIGVKGPWGTGEAQIWAEWLQPDAADVEVELRYGAANGWLDQQAAMVSRRTGMGRFTYIGAWLDDALMRRAATWMLQVSQIELPFTKLPDGVEVCRRDGHGHEVYLFINHAPRPCQVAVPRPMEDVLHKTINRQWVNLEAREVAVLIWAR